MIVISNMELRGKRLPDLYDIWTGGDGKATNKKLHPSKKRTKKACLPHPGQSYNPDPVEHQKLLKKVLDKEMEYRKKKTAIDNAMKVNVDAGELKRDSREELVSGIKHLLPSEKNDPDSDGESTDYAFSEYDEKDFEAIAQPKQVIEKRKTHQQRLKQMKDKLQRRAAKLRKLKNIRLSRFDSIKKISKELDKRDKEASKKRKTHRNLRNERLGQKFEQSDPIYCLSDKLPGSLRETSCPMNSIVREQLESFQSRLMVEPTSYQTKKRKYKKRTYDRETAADAEREAL